MIRVVYRWRGHRSLIQPGWRSKVLPPREARIDALSKRLAGHEVRLEDVRPVQVGLFGGQ